MRGDTAMSEAGFTLMEVLAALLIFSFAGLGLMASVNQSVQLGTEVETRTYAGIVAENLIAQMSSPTPNGGRSDSIAGKLEGEGRESYLGREFEWRLSSTFLDEADLIQKTITVTRDDRVVATRTVFAPRRVVRVETQ